jgi:hypothetical protein
LLDVKVNHILDQEFLEFVLYNTVSTFGLKGIEQSRNNVEKIEKIMETLLFPKY